MHPKNPLIEATNQGNMHNFIGSEQVGIQDVGSKVNPDQDNKSIQIDKAMNSLLGISDIQKD